ncbi:glycoside hydrolase family 95 protein [Chitinophaga sp. RAB17]|uniref:glycoside hydrolase family 95 protein n=1 Tax=Chitinophaga sp. RAB17 TaxID=3233049 RepID=UPI003F92D201
MRKIYLLAALLFGYFQLLTAQSQSSRQAELQMISQRPATAWLEAFPSGNGSLGAMVFGGTDTDRIQFNESSLCTGTTDSVGYYQPFGNIYVRWGHLDTSHYQRRLLLNSGVQEISYDHEGTNYTRQYFVSYPDQAFIMHANASRRGKINVEIMLRDVRSSGIQVSGPRITFAGDLRNTMKYEAIVQVMHTGGRMQRTDSSLVIQQADELTLQLVAGTNFKPFSGYHYLGDAPHTKLSAQLDKLLKKPFKQLQTAHSQDFSALFNRVALHLGATNESPVTERLLAYSKRAEDPAFEALLFQYGRYLLISSSRKGGLPANLQGIWNNESKPAWYSQYTTNINIQMNYWLAEPTNLSECHFPYFDWVENLAAVNKQSNDSALKVPAGWVAYSTNNIMGGPSKWRMHRPGSAWLVQHFWEHYAYTGDTSFLRQRAFPLLKEIVQYWEAHLVKRADGKLITPDGWSPEHGPGKKEGDKRPYPGASYDQQIVYDLFSNYLAAAAVLKTDEVMQQQVTMLRGNLVGPQVGKWGQLQEWMEDVDDSTDHHRHSSHLFAVYPGHWITPQQTPAWARAAERSLLARGMESTGWSTAWRINIWARLGEGNYAHEQMKRLIRPAISAGSGEKSGLYPNLFDAHPPFQIDGNFGYTAGVAEMLLQSHEGAIHLLPALPDAWPEGYVKGLKSRGNVTVDIYWSGHQLKKAVLKASRTGTYAVRYGNIVKQFLLEGGKPHSIHL